MDELSQYLDNGFLNNSKNKKTAKRKLIPPPAISSPKPVVNRISKQSLSSMDEGFESSLNSLKDTIAKKDKRRKRNTKQFNSEYFFDSVENQFGNKDKSNRTIDAVIDVKKFKIIGKKSLTWRTSRKEFGEFEGNLEILRKKSFAEKESSSCPIPSPNTAANPKTKKLIQKFGENQIQTRGSLKRRNSRKCSFQSKNSLKTNIGLSSDEGSEDNSFVICKQGFNLDSDSGKESVYTIGLEKWNDNYTLMNNENKNLWIDKDFQSICLKYTIETLKNDNKGEFRRVLKDIAEKVYGLPGLPSGPNVIPIVCYNSSGELNFEYYFISEKSPIIASERLRIHPEIIYQSRVIYDCICRQRND